MKKLIIVLFGLITCAFASVNAQSNQKTIDGPQFKFNGGDTWDFGIIPRGPIANHEFEFTNTGTQPIIITDVTPSCGCTGVDWVKSPVLPGQKGWIKLGLKTIEQHGVFDKEVYIMSNAVNIPHGDKRYTIYIKGDAKDDEKK
jgi:hypothetical protein